MARRYKITYSHDGSDDIDIGDFGIAQMRARRRLTEMSENNSPVFEASTTDQDGKTVCLFYATTEDAAGNNSSKAAGVIQEYEI